MKPASFHYAAGVRIVSALGPQARILSSSEEGCVVGVGESGLLTIRVLPDGTCRIQGCRHIPVVMGGQLMSFLPQLIAVINLLKALEMQKEEI